MTLVSMDGDSFVVDAAAIVVSKLLDAMVDGEVLAETACSCTALLQQMTLTSSPSRCLCYLHAGGQNT